MDAEMSHEKLWGEIPEFSSNPTSSLVDVIEPKAIEYEVPRLHQPSSEAYPPKDELPSEFLPSVKCPVDRHKQNLMLHSIELQYHKRRMRLVLMAAQHQQAEAVKSDCSDIHQPLPSPPPKPSRFCSSQGIITPPTNSTLLARMHSNQSAREIPKLCYPHLDSASNRQLLLRSVASICAFSGFEMCNESALETLTDSLHDFITRLCKVLRAAVDDEARTGHSPFPDVMDAALHQVGLGGASAVHKYWKNSIQDYALRLQREDNLLIQQYQKLTDPSSRTGYHEETALAAVKIEDGLEGKYSSSAAFRTMSTSDQNSDGMLSMLSLHLSSNGNGMVQTEGVHDPTSPHWTMHYKTEPVDDSYDDPISVVPPTPHSSS